MPRYFFFLLITTKLKGSYSEMSKVNKLIRLPKDIEFTLQKKYPDFKDMVYFVHDLFEAIKNKSFDDGSCTLSSFGSFYSYKTFSGKKGRIVVRFKFAISKSFNEAIATDEYIINKIDKNISHRIKLDTLKKEWREHRDENKSMQNLFFNKKRETSRLTKEKVMNMIISDFVTQQEPESGGQQSKNDVLEETSVNP